MPSPAASERAALLALMSTLGPSAETLCEGWMTHEMAAHLVARERRPQALPGIVFARLHPVTEFYEHRQATRTYDELLGDLQSGPPLWSAARWSDAGELAEWYVHHEDVRRPADPSPRVVSPELDAALWTRLAVFGRVNTLRARGLGISITTPDGRARRVRRGPQEVTVHGTPAELTMWLFGRRGAADVRVEGDAGSVQFAQAVPLGL